MECQNFPFPVGYDFEPIHQSPIYILQTIKSQNEDQADRISL